jgi:hypothetical protein
LPAGCRDESSVRLWVVCAPAADLLLTNAAGQYVLYPGNHGVCVQDGTNSFCTTVVVPTMLT